MPILQKDCCRLSGQRGKKEKERREAMCAGRAKEAEDETEMPTWLENLPRRERRSEKTESISYQASKL